MGQRYKAFEMDLNDKLSCCDVMFNPSILRFLFHFRKSTFSPLMRVGVYKILWFKLSLTTFTVTMVAEIFVGIKWLITWFGLISYWLFWYSFMILEIPLVCLLTLFFSIIFQFFQLYGWYLLNTGHLTPLECFYNCTAIA